jgi:hypothetical protein
VNEALRQLGYGQIDEHWGSGGDPKPGTLRIVSGHSVEEEIPFASAGTVVVECGVFDELRHGANVGAALRANTVRYYGPPVVGYGAEHDLFSRVPAALEKI